MSNQINDLKMGQKFKKTPAGEIPVDWGLAPISAVSEILGGGTPDRTNPEYWDGKIFWATPTDVTAVGGVTISRTKGTISETGLKNSSANLMPPGSVLMTSRATLGYTVINTVPMATNQGFINFIPSNKLDNYFLMYYLRLKAPELERLAAGSTFLEIPKSALKTFFVPIPTLSEQRKISEIILSIDGLVEKISAEIEKTKELKKGLMRQLLTRGIEHKKFKKTPIGEIPSEWNLTPLGELAEVRRGASPRPIDDAKYFGDGPGWVRIVDVTRSVKYLRTTVQKLSQLGVENSVLVKPGDVIMSICATIGKPVILDMHACIHDGFVFFDKLSKNIINEYLYYFLQFKEAEFASSGQPGAQKNLNIGIVSRMMIPLPGVKEQKEILSIVSALDEDIESGSTLLEKTTELKKGLMNMLLTGKVRVK